MNKRPGGGHPPEEQLLELALKGATPQQQEHLDSCPSCARTVREFREVHKQLVSLEEEDVPVWTEQRIFNITRHGHPSGLFKGSQSLLANPFLVALAVAVVVIVIYFLVGMEVFKAP